jgi:hypothetical protein
MKRYEFQLHLSAEQCLEYYRGAARHVVVREANGQTVQFPASLIQRFVTADGVHGHFVLTCDDQNKHAALQRLPTSAQA